VVRENPNDFCTGNPPECTFMNKGIMEIAYIKISLILVEGDGRVASGIPSL
jgi:hypothetical protein